MNYSFLLFFLIVGFIPFAFADVEHGKNYDLETISINSDGTKTVKQTFLNYDRILNNGEYEDYVFSDIGSALKIQTAKNTVLLNVSSCAFEMINENDVSLFVDSIIPFNSIVDLYSWNEVTQIINASCESYYDQANNALVAKKYVSGIGFMEYKYIFIKGAWKTQLEVTNLSSLDNRVFGFDQTIDLNRDTVYFGGQQRNLDNFDNQTFSRTWLENNEGSVMDFLNGLYFDLDLGFDYLDSVSVFDTGINSSKIVFHYMRNNEILMPNNILIIDPTFGYSTGSKYAALQTGAISASCTGVGDSISTSTTLMLYRENSAVSSSPSCQAVAFEYDISEIPDNVVEINSVNFRIDFDTVNGAVNCDYTGITGTQPSTRSNDAANALALFNDITGGTSYVSNDSTCTGVSTNNVFDLGSNAITDVQSQLSNDWFVVGFAYTDYTRTSGDFEWVKFDPTDAELEITYSYPFITQSINFDVQVVGDAAKVTGNVVVNGSTNANLTSILFFVNDTLTNTNSTIQNSTSTPYVVNFGPLWYQMITDSVYNFTIQTFVQNSTNTVSNSSSVYDSWGYDPDYFTAIDPTQGLVNYTFNNDNFLNVNRDTSGVVFDVECQYFTQSQAFFDDLENGVWDNETNVLFYVGDTSGFYYIRCFNDGELFVTAISQNYSNALVPGLVIFDQLGGFFGAPSIILVVLAILSLGTGRNYPIILLIAVSVTGILLSLELLTLDPGLVVALIVMTGIGLFGIRKFY